MARAAAALVALVSLNLYVCRDIFRIDTGAMNSMQGFWAAIARIGPAAPWRAEWWPWWDTGMPAEFTYAPLFPALSRLWAGFAGISHTLAVRCMIGAVYCLGPATLFLLAWILTRRLAASFAAGLLYSLFSLGQPLAPDTAQRFASLWNPQRLYLAAVWDEAPHLLALALLPVAVALLSKAMRQGSLMLSAAASAVFASMALASAFGPAMSALACIALVAARRQGLWRTVAVGAAAYALAAPYLTPSVVKAMAGASAFGPEGGWTWNSLAALAITGAVFAGMERWTRYRLEWPVRFFALFAMLASAPPLLETYLHWHFVPQPNRYKLEMEFGIALVTPFLIRKRSVRVGAAVLLVALGARQLIDFRRFAKATLRRPEVTQTVEYRAATWIAANLPRSRVFLPGSIAQWANAFAGVHQLSGGSWSTAYNPAVQHGVTGILSGDKPLAWLVAFGAEAIAVAEKDSAEFWKPFANPAAFASLPVLWRDSGVTIYRIPGFSLAHEIAEESVVGKPPVSFADTTEIERYAAALGRAPATAAFRWVARERIEVRLAAPVPGRILSVQVSYHPRWRATVEGVEREVRGDGLGLMAVRPECSRPCTVELAYR